MSKKKKLDVFDGVFLFLFFSSIASFVLFGFLWDLRFFTGAIVCFLLSIFFGKITERKPKKKAGKKK